MPAHTTPDTRPRTVTAHVAAAVVPLAAWAAISGATGMTGRGLAVAALVLVTAAAHALAPRRAVAAAAVWTVIATAVHVPAIIGTAQMSRASAWIGWAAAALLWWSWNWQAIEPAIRPADDDEGDDEGDDPADDDPAEWRDDEDDVEDAGALQVGRGSSHVSLLPPRTEAERTRTIRRPHLVDITAPDGPDLAAAVRRIPPSRTARVLVTDLADLVNATPEDMTSALSRAGVTVDSTRPVRPFAAGAAGTRRPSVDVAELRAAVGGM